MKTVNYPSFLIFGINYSPENTGSAPYTSGLAEALKGMNCEVEVFAGVPHYPSWTVPRKYKYRRVVKEVINRIPVRRFRHFVPKTQSIRGRILWELSFLCNTLIAIPSTRPDVVIASTPSLSGAISAFFHSKRTDSVFAIVIQDILGLAVSQSGIQSSSSTTKLVRTLESWIFNKADFIYIPTDSFKDYIVSCGVAESRIKSLPNWTHILEPSRTREDARKYFEWASSDFIILHTGNMGLKQDLGNVVEASRILNSDKKYKFILCGDGNQRDSLEMQAAGLSRISFIDGVSEEEYPNLLLAADVLLVNERSTVGDMSLPSKLTSYLAIGNPIIAAAGSDGACAKFLKRSRGSSMLVPASDPIALCNAIKFLEKNPRMRDEMKLAGRDFYFKNLSFEVALGNLLSLKRELLSHHNKAN